MYFKALRKILAIKSYFRDHPITVLRDVIFLSQHIHEGVAANDQEQG